MAQYDVYRNPHAAARASIPYIVDIQSDFISQLPTRLAAPLTVRKLDMKLPTNLCPEFHIEGQAVVLKIYDAAAISPRQLDLPVGSLAPYAHQIVSAMDAVMSGY